MTDPTGKTFQQTVILGEIEKCMALSYARDPNGIGAFTQSWQGLVLLIDEYEGMPEDLRSQTYFKQRLTFSNRTPIPVVRAYLMKVHRWVDTQTQRGLHR